MAPKPGLIDPLTAIADAVLSPISPSSAVSQTSGLIASPTANVSATGKLYALADIHLSFPANRDAWAELQPHSNDGLILCGDVGESLDHLHLAFSSAVQCFSKVWWCPGNHELYTLPTEAETGARGEEKYLQCVDVARIYGVLTPEDDFAIWNGQGGPALVAPVFTLYDYSFKPDEVNINDAVAWARERDIEATDEHLLHPDPYPSRIEWCHSLVSKFESKLQEATKSHLDLPLIIVNHWQLRSDLVYLPRVPRFRIWCGTTLTEDWPERFNAKIVISGHIHIRRTDWKNGIRYEEVSLGYPRQWGECRERGMTVNDIMREILPGEDMPVGGSKETKWRRYG